MYLRHSTVKKNGKHYTYWRLWQALGLDRLLAELLPSGREDIPWAAMAAVLVIARLCEPSSELQTCSCTRYILRSNVDSA